jgi:hypothetical protein
VNVKCDKTPEGRYSSQKPLESRAIHEKAAHCHMPELSSARFPLWADACLGVRRVKKCMHFLNTTLARKICRPPCLRSEGRLHEFPLFLIRYAKWIRARGSVDGWGAMLLTGRSGFEFLWGHWIFSSGLFLPTAGAPGFTQSLTSLNYYATACPTFLLQRKEMLLTVSCKCKCTWWL